MLQLHNFSINTTLYSGSKIENAKYLIYFNDKGGEYHKRRGEKDICSSVSHTNSTLSALPLLFEKGCNTSHFYTTTVGYI